MVILLVLSVGALILATAGWSQPFEGIDVAAGSVSTVAKTVIVIAVLAEIVALLLSVASLVVRFRRSTGEERLQLKWFVSAAAVAALALSVGVFIRRAGRLGTRLDLVGVPVRRDRHRDGEAQPLRHRSDHQQDDHVRGARGVHHRGLRDRGGGDRRVHRGHRGRLADRDRGRRRGVPADPAASATDRQPARLRGAGDALRGPVPVLRAGRRDLLGRGHPGPDGAAPRRGDGRHVGRRLAPGRRRGPAGGDMADERSDGHRDPPRGRRAARRSTGRPRRYPSGTSGSSSDCSPSRSRPTRPCHRSRRSSSPTWPARPGSCSPTPG